MINIQVVEAIPTVNGERHLAVCSVSKHHGPPLACTTVAIILPMETFFTRDDWPF